MKMKWKIISACGVLLFVGTSLYASSPVKREASANDSKKIARSENKVAQTANQPAVDDKENPKSFWIPNVEPTEEAPLNGWVNEGAVEPDNAELSSFIESNHETFNDLLEYDRYRNFDWNKFQDTAATMKQEVEKLTPSLKNPDIKLDITRLYQLIEVGTKKQDIDALLYAHRILQDLDVEYNERGDSKFGFSAYHQGGENQMMVAKYLNKNKKLVGAN